MNDYGWVEGYFLKVWDGIEYLTKDGYENFSRSIVDTFTGLRTQARTYSYKVKLILRGVKRAISRNPHSLKLK